MRFLRSRLRAGSGGRPEDAEHLLHHALAMVGIGHEEPGLDVEIELVYGVEEVTDAGMRVAIAQARLAEMPEALIHRVRMRLVDPTVRALPVADKAD